jgi:hypothetical protein
MKIGNVFFHDTLRLGMTAQDSTRDRFLSAWPGDLKPRDPFGSADFKAPSTPFSFYRNFTVFMGLMNFTCWTGEAL